MIGKIVLKYTNLTLLFLLTLYGCSSEPQQNQTDIQDTEKILKHNVEEAKTIFYVLPSPIETSSLLKKAGAEYDASILNPVENVNNYELANVKAINLGIYGSDLSYASVFDQTQEIMFYMSACKKLADGLGLSNAFDAKTMERMEENINDKDSLMQLISDSYWMADAYLEENDRSNLSALIISGGWVEGLYIATQLTKTNPTEELIARVAEQKLSLPHLLEIIKTYKNDHGDVAEMYRELEEIKRIFDKISVKKSTTTITKNKETSITTIGGANQLQISKEVLKELTTKIETLRNRYIQ